MRILALDVGDVRIGLALSDALKITAQGLETLTRSELNKDINHIVNVIEKNEVSELVVGLPKNMNGTLGPQGEKVKQFVEEFLKVKDIKVSYIDERLTTVIAEKTLISGDVSRKKRKQVVDKIAATIILQSYLERIN
ncbi:putative holliday junction resolvase [Desulfonispora thiosulfatigenes DSM 11270]|uniref:Putative pre-16S rRNA nuclease n=1 Tax=Desulfonispora thiosulfatigenes DSM 11270 TaxID=656914 RepID=A0A1W1VRR0_DESTI|nr:Holliday junction resolvase RuvX [Desulfonispora thiosulfatigenes]SMB95604.1 putative holliday junction resolvase [Desulfonispora thiosulfatigenes DSM 11270]